MNGIERMDSRRLLRTRWLPVIAYAALIFALSSIPGLGVPGTFQYRDKMAHLLEYGGLGWLVWRAARDTWLGAPKLARGLLAVLAVSAVGAADERYQANVPRRESSAYDWAADTIGASLAQVVCLAREKREGSQRVA